MSEKNTTVKLMKLREGTTDQCVYDEVIGRNCYRVPESLVGKIVIDIGAHIGCFSKLCADRGAARVLSYEIEPDNIATFYENMKDYADVDLYSRAVWKIGGVHMNQSGPYMTADGTLRNTGSSHVTSPIGPHTSGEGRVETATLDQILETIHSRVALVKIDAEGAEFEIVPATKSWAKVDRLVGECHGYRKEYHVPDLYMEIKRHFPNLEVVSTCPEYGLENFFAWR